ncbi:hypothetical protein EJ08DRAFT_655006 [Tothia fuscella]|uniref:Uncharacterized protein n=1 Tax=Tothia fuscella TaxID=1048955 RepID=A0A9P4U4N1_9PEZI|nr:hypothetical protein EJ08DRAFT_655006 [Tothia fuscella]
MCTPNDITTKAFCTALVDPMAKPQALEELLKTRDRMLKDRDSSLGSEVAAASKYDDHNRLSVDTTIYDEMVNVAAIYADKEYGEPNSDTENMLVKPVLGELLGVEGVVDGALKSLEVQLVRAKTSTGTERADFENRIRMETIRIWRAGTTMLRLSIYLAVNAALAGTLMQVGM